MLSLLFTCMFKHGYCPNTMLAGVMIPVPKIKGTCKSDNFRAITLSSTLSKLFDLVILKRCEQEMATSDMQFGFKPNLSTTMCSFISKRWYHILMIVVIMYIVPC